MKQRIVLLLMGLTLAFIFLHSFAGKEQSSQESAFVMQLIEPFLELFVGKGHVTEHLVRKLAHFCEFGLLGFLLGVLRKMPTCGTLLFALLAALTDETIQIFTGRGPQVQDVWLDFSGALTGMITACLLLWLCKAMTKRRKNRQAHTAKNA